MKRPGRYLPPLRAAIARLQAEAREHHDRFAQHDAETCLVLISELQELERELNRGAADD